MSNLGHSFTQNLSELITNLSEDSDSTLSNKIFDYIQFICTTLGFIGNLLTLITLSKNGKRFSRLILILFQHQSFVDCLVCGMASALILQPHLWMSGHKIFDYFLCHCWHSQVSHKFNSLPQNETYNSVATDFSLRWYEKHRSRAKSKIT